MIDYKTLCKLAYWSARGSCGGLCSKSFHMQILREMLECVGESHKTQYAYDLWADGQIGINYK